MKSLKKVLFILVILSILVQIVIPKAYAKGVSTIIYNGESLYEKIGNQAVLDNIRSEHVASDTGIDFTKGASSTNGQGVYTIASTANDKFPIYYYRGNIDNNNVLFGGFCWQIVRTTETGGVKLIYNGSPDENGKCEDIMIDEELMINTFQNTASYMVGLDEFNTELLINSLNIVWYELASNLFEDVYYSRAVNKIANEDFYYSKEVEYSRETNTYTLKNAQHHNSGDSIGDIKGETPIYICYYSNSKECSNVDLILWTTYSEYDGYVQHLELSNGVTYQNIKNVNLIFANDVEYKDESYQLKNTISIPLMTLNTKDNENKILNGYHYFCDDFSASCGNVNYMIPNYAYLKFKGGYSAKNKYNECKTSTNENDSEMKEVIDRWYSENFIYNNKYLEDTIWCNDRSRVANIYDKDFNFAKYSINDFKLSHVCSNKNDRFTVSSNNGNGKLNYPVATITDREVAYAGSPSIYINNSEIEKLDTEVYNFLSYYGNEYYDKDFLTMTPYDIGVGLYAVNYSGNLREPTGSCGRGRMSCDPTSFVRPMVSLKNNMVVSKGNGMPTNPYEVIEGYSVEYVIDGDLPKGFMPPEVNSYLKGSKVKLNSLKAGDVINGYRFLGWETKDVEIENNEFEMPDKNVVLIGRFEKIIETPNTLDDIEKYITIILISSLTLATLLITKKRITN